MAKSINPPNDLIPVSKIIERGWTKGMINRLLGEADGSKPNPFYRSAAPMKLYSIERVRSAEASDEFASIKQKAQARSHASKARAQTAREELTKEALNRVRLTVMPFSELERRALQNKRERDIERGLYDNPAYAEEHHIHRWMVNYARHQLSNYDRVRSEYHGRVGVHDAAEMVRDAVLTRIAERWPELAQACEKARRTKD